jgi:hypothetical protein
MWVRAEVQAAQRLAFVVVITGLDPVIPLRDALLCGVIVTALLA